MSVSAPAPRLILDEIDSTNLEARRKAERGEVGPLWIVARRQSAGRGRRGRAWSAPEGNLSATLLTTTQRPPAEAARVSFVAALAVAETISLYVPESLVGIKWPNDVLIDGRKAAGILVESGALTASRGDGAGLWLAVGIGINIRAHPEDVERPATHVGAHLRPELREAPSIEQAAEALAASFARWQSLWEGAGDGPVLDAWSRRARGLHGPCTARLGHETLTGRADGLAEDGALRLIDHAGRLHLISAGDVFFGEQV